MDRIKLNIQNMDMILFETLKAKIMVFQTAIAMLTLHFKKLRKCRLVHSVSVH